MMWLLACLGLLGLAYGIIYLGAELEKRRPHLPAFGPFERPMLALVVLAFAGAVACALMVGQ